MAIIVQKLGEEKIVKIIYEEEKNPTAIKLEEGGGGVRP